MLTILAAAWLCLPMVPLNPIEEDTLSTWNLHFTAGASSRNHFVSTGLDLTVKAERLAVHPLVLLTALEYQYGKINSRSFFAGQAHQATLAACAVYYRGTDKWTGYVGAGPVLRMGRIVLTQETADSLWTSHAISDVDIRPALGYRLLLGLRYHKAFSLEIGITEVTTNLHYIEDLGPGRFAISREEVNLGSVRVTLGYVLTLMD